MYKLGAPCSGQKVYSFVFEERIPEATYTAIYNNGVACCSANALQLELKETDLIQADTNEGIRWYEASFLKGVLIAAGRPVVNDEVSFEGKVEITFSVYQTNNPNLSNSPSCKLLTGVLIHATKSVGNVQVTLDITEV